MKNPFHDEEEKQLLARLSDRIRLAEKRNRPIYTDFLSPAQQQIAKKHGFLEKYPPLLLWGGYEDAERKMGVFIPNRYEKEDFPIAVLALRTRGDYPTHPEILGALTGLGIRREKIGDILTGGDEPLLICHEDLAPFLKENFTKAGRKAFRAEDGTIGQIPEAEHTVRTATVPSLRLDCVTAEGFGIARTKAAELIRKGAARLNWLDTDAPDASVGEGDVISLKGYGRLVLEKVGGTSKKNRIFITVKQYTQRK